MHVRWRGLELPARVIRDEQSLTDTFGRFTIEPFERGFGTTIGNSIRRVLLSSIEGAAITSIRIKGVEHEFCTLEGVAQDMVDVVLNVKGLVVGLDSDEPRQLRLSASGPGEVTADLIEADPAVTIYDPQHVIATLTDAVDFEMELTIERGRGYVPASEQYASLEEQVIGEIPIDAVFSPVQRVRHRVESTRVGQKTNYDRLIMDIWTDGTVSPEMTLVEAAKILRKHLNALVQYDAIGSDTVSMEAAEAAAVDDELMGKLSMPVSDLDLTVRSSNCLDVANIRTIANLVTLSDNDLLSIRSLGRTSLREIKRKLEDLGLSLGMQLPPGVVVEPINQDAFSSDELYLDDDDEDDEDVPVEALEIEEDVATPAFGEEMIGGTTEAPTPEGETE